MHNVQLNNLRQECEEGFKVVFETEKDIRVLVILTADEGKFTCNRYFKLGNKWVVSVDKQAVELKKAFQWLWDEVNH